MKAYTYQLSALLLLSSVLSSSTPASAQGLPPVNWGKTVHGPGDCQYIGEQQNMRHPVGMNTTPTRPQVIPMSPPPSFSGGGGMVAYRPTPRRPKPDISLQPIPADEPVIPPGFPPLPDRLDIPGVDMTTAMSFNAQSGGGGGGGGGGYMGGGGGASINPFQGKKQGYAHYVPGSFSGQTPPGQMMSSGGGGGGGMPPMNGGGMPAMNGGGGGGSSSGGGGDVSFHQHYGHVDPGSYAEKPKSVGYYKCRERAQENKPVTFAGDTFGSSGEKPPAYSGLTTKQMNKMLGREPKLNDKRNSDADAMPEAPQPVSINQASTQDLSLPDDDFKSRRPPGKGNGLLSRMGKRLGNRVLQTTNSAMGAASSAGMSAFRSGGGH